MYLSRGTHSHYPGPQIPLVPRCLAAIAPAFTTYIARLYDATLDSFHGECHRNCEFIQTEGPAIIEDGAQVANRTVSTSGEMSHLSFEVAMLIDNGIKISSLP